MHRGDELLNRHRPSLFYDVLQMASEDLRTLRTLTATIADSERPLRSLGHTVMDYSVFLRDVLTRGREGFAAQREQRDSSMLASGAALSPWNAAACTEDQLRTAAFVRGAIQGVEHQLKTTSKRPLHLLEAGCGPLGTLVLPLLARFSADELEISLIDLHHEAIESVRAVLDQLGFGDRVRQLICGDVMEVELEALPDIVLTETMNRALFGEPQVEITRSLVQHYPGAMLLPQGVEVKLSLVDAHAEAQSFPMQAGDRSELGTVFVLDQASAAGFEPDATSLPAASVRLPGEIAPNYYPYLTTRVTIFDDVFLEDYDSAITIPVSLDFPVDQLPLGQDLHFSYLLGRDPGLRWNPSPRLEATDEKQTQGH